jgi:Mor family transcriptional regulator
MGGALLTYGLIRYLVKGKKVGRVMEEGMIKGYILGLNIDPLRKRYSMTLALAF